MRKDNEGQQEIELSHGTRCDITLLSVFWVSLWLLLEPLIGMQSFLFWGILKMSQVVALYIKTMYICKYRVSLMLTWQGLYPIGTRLQDTMRMWEVILYSRKAKAKPSVEI